MHHQSYTKNSRQIKNAENKTAPFRREDTLEMIPSTKQSALKTYKVHIDNTTQTNHFVFMYLEVYV